MPGEKLRQAKRRPLRPWAAGRLTSIVRGSGGLGGEGKEA